jgi:membrane protein YqaA with SNARE-associated domain
VTRLSIWLQEFLGPLGLLGIVIIAFFDSSFLSLPEINDIMVVSMTLARPAWMPLYALAAATGSVLGSLTLHTIGKRGGGRLLRAKLEPQRIERLRGLYRRFDVLTVIIPSLLPPPCPFKIFVLGSGVFGMSTIRFIVAVAIGRTTRYMAEGWLALKYGPAALDLAREHPLETLLIVAGLVLLVFGAWRLAARYAARENRPPQDEAP